MATNGPAPAVMAAAGREAAGMARRFVNRFLDRAPLRRLPLGPRRADLGRVLAGQTSAFTARLLSDQRLRGRLGAASLRVTDLLAHRSLPATRHTPPPALPFVSRPAPVRKQSRRLRRDAPVARPMGAGMSAPAFRPVSFPPARQTPHILISRPLLTAPAFLRPQSGLAAFEAVTSSPRDVPSAEPHWGTGLRPTVDVAPPVSGRRASPTPGIDRRQRPGDNGGSVKADYRRLGPTGLRDTLRQRGGRGAALDLSLRERLRGTLGFDPSLARLHRGAVAADAARALRAQAFTIGQDVFFGEGRFDTTSRAGLELLTHELTHVGQQTRTGRHQTRFFTAQGGDAQEEEARQTAARLMMPRPPLARPTGSLTAPSSWTAPEMQLAMPPPSPGRRAAGLSAPIQRTLDPTSVGGGASLRQSPRPQAVADHVYELMKQEVLRDNRRGLLTGKG